MKHKLSIVILLVFVLFIYQLCFVHYIHPHHRSSSAKSLKCKRLPGCILIGVRKGGTRALLDMLNLHSAIRVANFEVHFFDNETNYQKGLTWYRDQMPSTIPGMEMALEKSPSYFVTPTVPKRIFEMDRNVKLLLIVRDPVTRLISDYTQILHNHLEKGLVFKSFSSLVINSGNTLIP